MIGYQTPEKMKTTTPPVNTQYTMREGANSINLSMSRCWTEVGGRGCGKPLLRSCVSVVALPCGLIVNDIVPRRNLML